MKIRILPLMCVLLPVALASSAAQADGPGKSKAGLTAAKVSKLARGTGKWVHVAKFQDGRVTRHLLCRRSKKAKRAGCVIATRDGQIVQRRITIAPTKDGRALAFRIGSKARDRWLRVGLGPSVEWDSENASSPQLQNGSMEEAFGPDFSHINVHPGGEAVSASIGAAAFTNGSHVWIGRSTQTAPKTNLVAHELTHTIAQGSGGDNPTGNTEENSSGDGGSESSGGGGSESNSDSNGSTSSDD